MLQGKLKLTKIFGIIHAFNLFAAELPFARPSCCLIPGFAVFDFLRVNKLYAVGVSFIEHSIYKTVIDVLKEFSTFSNCDFH